VGFNGRANRVGAQLASFLEERMHGPALHQANEKNHKIVIAFATRWINNAYILILELASREGDSIKTVD
jgi:hypothetical protein